MARKKKEVEPPDDVNVPEDSDKPSIKFWIDALKASEDASREYRKIGRRAWEEFTSQRKYDRKNTGYPAFWSAISTMQPAIYSQTPKPASKRVFTDRKDSVARVAAMCLDRLSTNLVKNSRFDGTHFATRDDFLMTGRATNRVIFESKIGEKPTKVRFVPVPAPAPAPEQMDPGLPPMPPPPPQMMLVDNYGNQPNPEAPLLQDEEGFYQDGTEESIDYVCAELIPTYFYDLDHNPNARNSGEVSWISFRAAMSKREVKAKWGAEVAEKLTYTPMTRGDEKNERRKKEVKDSSVLYADIREVWDRDSKKVMWICPEYTDDFVHIEDDPYELLNFFPCPDFIFGTVGPDDLYPVPAFYQLEGLIGQIHQCFARLKGAIKATKRKAAVDGSIPELKELAEDTDEGDFLVINKLMQLLGEGGLEKVIKFFPVKEFANAAVELSSALQLFEQKVYELFGIPDILRGVTDPEETLGAQQLKGHFTSVRFSAIQRDYQRLVRDGIELMCDLALKKYPERKIQEICGVAFMKPEDQQVWPQVYQLLKNDKDRQVRIDIETDSTITMNENADIEQRNYLAKTLFEGLGAVATASQANPAYAQASMQLLLYLVRGVRDGGQIEEQVEAAIEQAMQPQQGEEDPTLQVEAQRNAVKQMEIETNARLKMAQMELDREKMAADANTNAFKAQLEAVKADSEERFRAMEAVLEQQRFKAEMLEKLMEERRLNRQEQNERAEKTAARGPQIHISHGPPKANKRKATMSRADGSKVEIEVEDMFENMQQVPGE